MGQLQIGGSGYFEGGQPSLSYFYLWQELGREVGRQEREEGEDQAWFMASSCFL